MEPLNSAERRTAFLKFTALFLVTAILIFAIFFVGSTIPGQQIKKLKEENELLGASSANSTLQFTLVDSMSKDLDRYDIDTLRQVQIEQEINLCAIQLKTVMASDSSTTKSITRDASVANINLLEAKKKLRDCGNSSATIAGLRQQNADLQKKYDDLYRDYTMLNKMSGGSNQGGSH